MAVVTSTKRLAIVSGDDNLGLDTGGSGSMIVRIIVDAVEKLNWPVVWVARANDESCIQVRSTAADRDSITGPNEPGSLLDLTLVDVLGDRSDRNRESSIWIRRSFAKFSYFRIRIRWTGIYPKDKRLFVSALTILTRGTAPMVATGKFSDKSSGC